MGLGAPAPGIGGISAPFRNSFVSQKTLAARVARSQSRDWERIVRQFWVFCRIDNRRRFNIATYSRPETDACRMASSATAGLFAVNARYRLASHNPMTTDRKRKH